MKQESDLYNPPNVEWFSQEQWDYLQKHYLLSPRELQVVKLVCCRGLENEEIANELNIAHDTIHVHLHTIYQKIKTNNKILMLLRFIKDVKNLKQGANL